MRENTFTKLPSTLFGLGALAAFAMLPQTAAAQSVQKRPVNASVQFSGSCAGCDMSGRVMPRISMQGSNFSGSDFSHSNLSGAKFFKSNFSGASFHKAYLMGVKGDGVNMRASVLRDATLTGASLRRSDLSDVDLRGADLTQGDFSGSTFTNASFESVDAMQANFSGSNFSRAKLDHASFKDANLSGVSFADVNFGDAILQGANLTGASFSNAKLSHVQGLTSEQLETACGDANSVLPAGLSVTPCADTVRLEAAAEAAPITSFKARPAPAQNSVFLDNVKRVSQRQTRSFQMERALKELDAAMRDLPLGSPTREHIENARDHLQKARSKPD